jgi:hypothetical protein
MVLLRRHRRRRRLAAPRPRVLQPHTHRSVVLHSSQERLAPPAGPVERRRRVQPPRFCLPPPAPPRPTRTRRFCRLLPLLPAAALRDDQLAPPLLLLGHLH